MPDYALFLNSDFTPNNGNFVDNAPPVRRPDARFWSVVQVVGGNLTASGARINADTRMLEVTARPPSPDRIYFAVRSTLPNTVVRNISFMCGIQMNIRRNVATTASPFRFGPEIQVNLEGVPNQQILVPPIVGAAPPDVYDAIGPYALFPDPGSAPAGECCYYKLTVSASIRHNVTNVIREYSHDPDMDVEL